MKHLLITFFVLFIFIGLSAVTDLINFDNTSNLTDLFNPDTSPVFTNTSDGGLNNTGCVNIPVPSEDIWTHKTGFSLPIVGETATISAYFKIEGYNGVSALGFSQANVNTFVYEQITNTSSLGMSFHGGGGFFFNNTDYSAAEWYSQSGDLVNGNWYKVVFNVHNQGSNVFDLDFQIWNSDSAGVVGTLFTTQSLSGLSNPDMAALSTIYPYFANSRERSGRIDNFFVEVTEPVPTEVVISSFPHTESFEGTAFPPEGWVSETSIGSEGFDLELETIDPENPTIYDTPHGNNWVRLESNPETYNTATLRLPRVDFPAGNEFYQITISRYVTNQTNNNTYSYIQVHRSDTPGVLGPLMGHISNMDYTNPDLGWRDESIYLGFLGGTSQYITLLVRNLVGDDINFDNIRIEVGSPWHPALPYPTNYSTDLPVNTWFGWGHYMMHGGTYSLHLSTDNVNFSSVYQGVYDSIDSLAVRLEGNTTYYWYVVASEYGNTLIGPTWSFTTGEVPFSFIESFEGATFPPSGWILMPEYGQPNLTLETNNPENPSIYDTPYGNHWVSLPSDPATANDAVMWSPRIDFPEGDSFYQIKMSRYITNTSTSYVQVNMGPNLYEYGPSLTQFYNSDEDSSIGWHDYTRNLGFVGGTSQYIALIVSNFNEVPHFDNIRIEEGVPWTNLLPVDSSEEVSLYTMFEWSDYLDNSNLYTLYLSTDNVNFTQEYQNTNGNTYLDSPLSSQTTYYWYVAAHGDGYSVSSPVWSFTTVSGSEPPSDIIVDFPYLADFQVDDPLWITVPLGGKNKSENISTPELKIDALLQKNNSDMSKYGPGLWERTLDGEANIAWKLPSETTGFLIGPYFHLYAGQTYEIKYNYRQSELSATPGEEGIALISDPSLSEGFYTDMNLGMTNTDYALRLITITPEFTGDYMFAFLGFSTVDLYFDNLRITQNGDDILTASALTVDGVSTPDPAPIYNTVTQEPLDTDLHISDISGTPEITATVSWSPPIVNSQNTGLKLNLHSPEGGLAGATVTFYHYLGYPPLSASYRIVPNAYSTMYNPNDGSWNSSRCVFTVPAGKADGDYEVILQLDGDEPLPVVLSSFTAIATQQNYVQLNWITQSETGVVGYYIYRSSTNILSSAQVVSNLITAQNSSQEMTYFYTDAEVQPGSWYYWLQNVDMDGQSGFHGSIHIEIQETGEGGIPAIPLVTSIQMIYPNPFNPSTTIAFGLAQAEQVNIQVFNVRGQLIRNLMSETKEANNYRIVWNGTNDKGQSMPTGIYYLRMSAGKFTATQKLVIMK